MAGESIYRHSAAFWDESAPLIFSAVTDTLAGVMQCRRLHRSGITRYIWLQKECGDHAFNLRRDGHASWAWGGWRPGHDHFLSGLGTRLCSSTGSATSPSQTQMLEGSTGQLEGKESMQEERPAFSDWLTHSCMSSSQTREVPCAEANWPINNYWAPRLIKTARADMDWWFSFISTWNGTAMMLAGPSLDQQITLTSDAPGNWGCGAYSVNRWFMLPWMCGIRDTPITVKELALIVIAALMWGRDWTGKWYWLNAIMRH